MEFLTGDSLIPPYLAFPRFLLERTDLNETAKILYVLLLDRARLSQKNEGWTDEENRVFLYFPIRDLAAVMHKSAMSIKTALSALEKEGLLLRKRQGIGRANRLYVKIPIAIQTELCPSEGQSAVYSEAGTLSPSNNQENNQLPVKSERGGRRRWCFQDNLAASKRTYECQEDESL